MDAPDLVYAGCSIAFTPLASPASLAQLDLGSGAVLAFCALNTVVGYGAFAELLAHWEASRVGAVLALTPLGGWIGALLVVSGSLAASLGAEAVRRR